MQYSKFLDRCCVPDFTQIIEKAPVPFNTAQGILSLSKDADPHAGVEAGGEKPLATRLDSDNF